MLNKRHLTEAEKQIIRAIFHDAGAVEMIRLLGSLVGHAHFDSTRGNELKSAMYKVANGLDSDSGPGVQ